MHHLQIGVVAVIMTTDSNIDMVLDTLLCKNQMPPGAFLTSFHESVVAAAKNSHSSPSCVRRTSRKSGCSDNHDRAHSRSRCIERFGDASATAARFSYHESMLALVLSSTSKDELPSLHAYADSKDRRSSGDHKSCQENSRSPPDTK